MIIGVWYSKLERILIESCLQYWTQQLITVDQEGLEYISILSVLLRTPGWPNAEGVLIHPTHPVCVKRERVRPRNVYTFVAYKLTNV